VGPIPERVIWLKIPAKKGMAFLLALSTGKDKNLIFVN
tara:strand:+ start:380 stop:493 length:114 start_codon:yes stop_codon:yes gene_type:complete